MMMKKNKMMWTTSFLFAMLSLAFIGCGGGDDAAPPAPAPSLEVLPADFQFATVTDGNSVEPLTVTLRNGGNADLVVSDIVLSDTVNFSLDVTTGTDACGSTAPTLASGDSCTVIVEFTPPLPPPFGSFPADLTIASNDAGTPYIMDLLGNLEDISEVNVRINQIEACPRSPATIYVSVTDQGGFPVTGLTLSEFSLEEDGSGVALTGADFVANDNTATISVALLMDYSGSITMEPDNVTDMENAAIGFVNQLGTNDRAEIIKYATDIEVTQAFTSNKTLLRSAIRSTPDIGSTTALYDAIVLAADNISNETTTTRRAIIVITDGMDRDGSGGQQSTNDLANVLADANTFGVPVFTVGLGLVDTAILEQIADDTGGTYSDSTTSDNLATIYQQLADLLFTDQYILTYASGLANNVSGDLEVTATYTPPDPDVSGSDTKTIPVCTP